MDYQDKVVSIKELALRSNRSPQYISNLIRRGILPRGAEGWEDRRERMLPLAQCLEILSTRPRRRSAQQMQAEINEWAKRI